MPYDITVRHPAYKEFICAWELMRDCMDGEEAIKAGGLDHNPEKYLPMKSGIIAIGDPIKQKAAYDAYKLRAEFPEIVGPTVRGATGIMLGKPTLIELPSQLESLRERATLDGLTLDALHRRVALELMITGRYGLLPGISDKGEPYLAGYVAESIINWDATNQVPDYVVLDETSLQRNRDTGEWEAICAYLECSAQNGTYSAKQWTKTKQGFDSANGIAAATPQRKPLTFLPFVFIGANDLGQAPDDIPLYGLARLAVRIYRMDADYTFALHMTSEPTPVAIGFDDPAQAIKDGLAPNTIGAAKLWVLPKGGDAKYLEFSGPGLERQQAAIQDSFNRAVSFGAQVMTDTSRAQESGDAKELRLNNQSATIKTVALNAAAGLERALKNAAIWIGADESKVKVTPDTEFFDADLSAQEITAIVQGWQSGAYSWRTTFDRLKKGGVIPPERTEEEEQEFIAGDEAERGEVNDPQQLFDPVTGKPIDPTTLPKQLTRPAA